MISNRNRLYPRGNRRPTIHGRSTTAFHPSLLVALNSRCSLDPTSPQAPRLRQSKPGFRPSALPSQRPMPWSTAALLPAVGLSCCTAHCWGCCSWWAGSAAGVRWAWQQSWLAAAGEGVGWGTGAEGGGALWRAMCRAVPWCVDASMCDSWCGWGRGQLVLAGGSSRGADVVCGEQ